MVFVKERVAVFCDGDFWHGRDLEPRLAKLARGHNAAYWVTKVQRNADRDRKISSALEAAGWIVLRFWETDVLREARGIGDRIVQVLADRRPLRRLN
jgi:DNA mismatch endonuclease (patch repair protein)